MTDPSITRSAQRSMRADRSFARIALDWFTAQHVWVRVLVVYLASRVFTTALMLLSIALSPATSRHGADPSLIDYVLGWDAQWYWTIAVDGYPSELPLDESGDAAQNAWAFMPLYAKLAQLVGSLFAGGAWWFGALVVSLVAGYFAVFAMYWLIRNRLTDEQSLWGAAFLAFCPIAAMFQVGYAEAVFLALLLFAINCVIRGWWRWLYLLVPIMAFTRPGILAFGLFIALYGIWRLTQQRIWKITRFEVIHILSLGALSSIVGFAWPVITGIATNDPGAYLATELSWRRGWTGESGFVPFEGWIQAAPIWAGVWGIPAWLGFVLLVAIVIGFALALWKAPQVIELGPELRLWAASYAIYLLAVFFPQSSTFRLLLPLAPLLGAFALVRPISWRIALFIGGCFLQWVWIFGMYGLGNTFWTVP